MTRTYNTAAPLLAAIAGIAVIGRGCATPPASSVSGPRADAGGDVAVEDAGPPDTGGPLESGVDASGPCEAQGDPAGVPPGWTRWNGYPGCCGLWVPSAPADLPEPIQWTPCDASAQPAGIVCRQMVVDWPWQAYNQNPFTAWISADLGANGALVIQVSRLVGPNVVRVIGAADGPLSQALLETSPSLCTAGRSRLAGGRYAFDVYQGNSPIGGGALAGAQTDLTPSTFRQFNDAVTHDVFAGAPGVLDLATWRLYAWPDGSTSQTLPSEPGFGPSEPTFIGNDLFWSASSATAQKIRAWTLSAGAADFVSYGTDTSQGAADLGSDGHDLVWLYGSGRTDPSGSFPVVSIMTSPFTTDPNALMPRRLRSETAPGFGTTPFIVGCGYATHQSANGGFYGIRVVRLSDGVSWFLSGDVSQPWVWASPFAITCTELFAKVIVHPADGGSAYMDYARVRLDSLGAGIPPD